MPKPKSIESERLQEILDDIADRVAGMSERGKVAQYIPELATVDLNQFGIAIAPIDGPLISAGDAGTLFSIQSISKVFSLTLALQQVGATLWQRVGREPSGDPFNSIVQLEHERGIPRNPFINPGAIIVADVLLEDRSSDEAVNDLLALCRKLSQDNSIEVDASVAESEMRTGSRNRALAHFMQAEGNLKASVEDVLSMYFRQCSIAMNCEQLALAGRFLAAAGQNPATGAKVLSPQRAKRVTALMMMCGSYDASGEFAFRVGLPAKSGVGGGILCIVPGIASVVAWSPGLDQKGNSHMATIAFQELVRATGWSIFGPSA
ncbi:glutaminase [Ruegeria sp. HKCCA5491]|uniref:glutaminase n=1 Tax=Ruegeria sp. HKCCA5491 TaxID=2682986 RepID=UPI0014883602|nr:glutaminase [Ruegeria sp. HKCCA5491]